MSAAHSSPITKPNKPTPDFPLFPHASGRWAKKIRGKLVYFGKWSDGPDAALAKYRAAADDLHAGRVTPADASAVLTVGILCGKYLTRKESLVASGELSPRSFIDYTATVKRLQKAFGKNRPVSDLAPRDFEKLRQSLTKVWGPVRVKNEIVRVRGVFRFATENGLIDRRVNFGDGFNVPKLATLRKHRHSRGSKMFEADEIRRLLDNTTQPLKAMILLGINCGFGNADVGTLPISAIDFDRAVVSFPRVKTGVPRRCHLWPETIAAIREWLPQRPTPKNPEHADALFLTRCGELWHKDTHDSPVSKELRKFLDKLGISGRRNFYALRHAFETVGGAARDQVAVDSIMGHADTSMAGIYRERIEDDRLKAVTDHVRGWLFGK